MAGEPWEQEVRRADNTISTVTQEKDEKGGEGKVKEERDRYYTEAINVL